MTKHRDQQVCFPEVHLPACGIASILRLIFLCYISILMLSASSPAFAESSFDTGPRPESARYYVPPIPTDMHAVDFYLITVGVGRTVADRFGHTGIRVHDRSAASDVVFNWGKYSFGKPGFLWRFFRGQLDYSMGVRTFQGDVLHHMGQERRMFQEKLNLTAIQKRRLMEKIAWNAVPENREFSYQYWFKNCSTIPRDYLDETVEGQVRAKFFAAPAGRRFRDYVRENLAFVPFVVPALDLMMNGNIDRPITVWEDMFLPANLRKHLLSMPAIDDEGNPVPGTRLLTESRILLDYAEPFSPTLPVNDYLALAAIGFVPLLVSMVLIIPRRGRTDRRSRQLLAWGYAWLGGSLALWGLLIGLAGLTLVFNWAFSGHPDGWQNVNLMLMSPLDLLLIPIGIGLMRERGPVKDRFVFLHSGALICGVHILGLMLLCVLAMAGVVTQDIWRIVLWFGTVTMAACAAMWFVGFRAIPAAEPSRAGQRSAQVDLTPASLRQR